MISTGRNGTKMKKVKTLWKRPPRSVSGILAGTLVVGLLLAASAGQSGWALAQGEGWGTPVMISTNTINSWFSDVAVDAWGTPHVVWNSGRATGVDREVMDLLMYSTLMGEEWLVPNDIAVTAYGGYTVRPAIAVDSRGTLHVTFRGGVEIYYTNSSVSEAWNASSWTPRRNISGAGAGAAYYSDVAVDEQGGIHVVWNESVSAGDGETWLWFGTQRGSALYDGTGWRHQENQEGLSDREVHAIIEDSAGVQWFGTDDGVYRFDGGTWQRFTVEDGLVAQEVNCVTQDPDDRLWFGTEDGVSVYDESEYLDADKWTSYTTSDGLPSNVVYAIATDPLGVVWAGTEKGLASFDGKNWVSHTPLDESITAEVSALAIDLQGNVWVGTAQGVNRYDGRHSMTYSTESGLLGNVITTIAVDRDGIVWVGTDQGLSRFDGQAWTSYAVGGGSRDSAVTALMADREGAIWVGTETGVSVYDGLGWKAFALPQGFVGQEVTAIAEDLKVNAICPLCADIFYRHSTDGGESWSAPVNLSNSFAGSVKPQVHIGNGGHVYITWEEGEDWYTHLGYPVASMYAHSPDGGNSWVEPIAFSSPLGAPQQITLGTGQDGDLVVVWRLPGEKPFYYQYSTDNGVTWSEPQPIPGVIAKPWEPFSLDAYHTATDSAGNVHLLVLGRRSSLDKDLGLIHVVWDGSQWSPPTVIYASSDPPEWPRIAVGAGNKVYATWFTRDEKHINDSARGRYQIWVSSYQADAPPQTPAPVPTPIPTLTLDASNQIALNSTTTPTPAVLQDDSELPPGLYTESDEIGQLILALSPVIVVVLIITALRLGWFSRRR
jgi:ligand-binding sensor domain-containing protein